MTVVGVTTEQTQLGEGVRWDARRAELLRVDIIAGRVFRDRVTEDGGLTPIAEYGVPGTVGAIAPIDGDDGWLLAAGRGFVHLRPDGSVRSIAEVCPDGTRMNDAACDSLGRMWAGTLADDHHSGGGALYRFDRDGRCTCVLDGLTISNGLGWSPDDSTMYLADSGPRTIYAFDFDVLAGTLSARRVLVEVSADTGAPDGLTVDASGDIWVAIYGGGQVQRYSPEGTLREVIHLPAEQTTCCAFAGEHLNRLYVTTATEGWDDERRRSEPAAGLVYRVDTGAVGRAVNLFKPDRDWWADPLNSSEPEGGVVVAD